MNAATRLIPVTDAQPGMLIHHIRTRATSGYYEVVAAKTLFGGATSIRIKAVSRSGVEFTAGVIYDAEETVEVVEVDPMYSLPPHLREKEYQNEFMRNMEIDWEKVNSK